MPQVIALFENQKKAEAAIDTLTTAKLDEKNIRTIETWEGDTTANQINTPLPAADASTGITGVPLPSAISMPGLELSDEEAQYFKRSVEAGGVLVSVELSDDKELSQAKHALEEQGGKVTVK